MEMEMEMERRKRSNSGDSEGRRTRSKEEKGDPRADQTEATTATEEEVEEFYAILRRVHEVVRYFGKGKSGGEGAEKRGSGRGWNPSFQWEDFDGNNGVVSENNNNHIKERQKRDVEAVEENLVVSGPVTLDLNAEPESVAE